MKISGYSFYTLRVASFTECNPWDEVFKPYGMFEEFYEGDVDAPEWN